MIRAYHPQTRATVSDWAAAFRCVPAPAYAACFLILALVGAAMKVL